MRAVLPAGAIPPTPTRVLLAVVTQARPTVRSIMDATGIRSPSHVHAELRRLRDLGLVTWQDRQGGTLRSTLTVVATGPGGVTPPN